MEDADLTRSMSKKAYTADKAACEGFFGRLKNDMFCNKAWIGISVDEFMEILNEYLYWYKEKKNQDVAGCQESAQISK